MSLKDSIEAARRDFDWQMYVAVCHLLKNDKEGQYTLSRLEADRLRLATLEAVVEDDK